MLVTSKQSSAFLKVFFAFVLCTLFFLLSHTVTYASWTYDKDIPVITVTAVCGDGRSIPYNGSYTCASSVATVTITCHDDPTIGGSGCQTMTYTTTNGGPVTTGEYPKRSESEATTTDRSVSISASSATSSQFSVSSASAIDWAGNSSSATFTPFNFTFATCSISAPASDSGTEGGTGTLSTTLTESVPGTTAVSFTSADTGLVTLGAVYDTYKAPINYLVRGDTTVTVSGKISGVERCSAIIPVHITAVGPWWQVTDNDIYSSGNITSTIPGTCTGSCVNKFDLDGTGSYPGIPSLTGTAYWGDPATGAVVSSRGWLANSSYKGRTYDYDWFLNQTAVPTDQIIAAGSAAELGATTDNAGLNTGLTSGDAIYRYRNGDLAINGDVNVGTNKVVLFVSGNLIINGKINLTAGQGFFAAIVHGTIALDGTSVKSNSATDYALEGFYLSNGVFNTVNTGSTTANRLVIRGAVAGLGGVTLSRDLSTPNTTTPAESFIYAPDLVLSMPYALMRQGIKWNEINP